MKKRRILIVLVVFAIGGIGSYTALKDRFAKPAGVITVSGNLEVTDVELSFRLPGWVKERPVDEGMKVTKGMLIARLDDTELKQEVALRTAELASAQAALDELQAGSRPEEIDAAAAAVSRAKAILAELVAGSRPEDIAAAEATVEAAKVELARTKLDYERTKALYDKGVAAQNEHDTARSAFDSAAAKESEANAKLRLVKAGARSEQIDQAKAALDEASQKYDMIKKGPRDEDKQQALARVEQLRQIVATAQTRLGYAELTSPFDGVVLSKNTEAGEFVAAGTPIVTVGDLKDIWLRAYIDEPDVARVKVGDEAKVTTDDDPKSPRVGKVSFISQEAEFTPKNVQTPKERVKLVFRIKIQVPNDDLRFKPGMPADAEIVTGK